MPDLLSLHVVEIPRAELAHCSYRRRLTRWLAQLLAAPRAMQTGSGFGAASHWSLTGGLAAGFALGFYLLCISGNFWHVDFTLTLGGAIFAGFGVVFWFWPFLASYYMYRLFARWLPGGRLPAALYGALWHASAHCALLEGLSGDALSSSVIVPLVVGALWGSWLPAAQRP